LTTSRSLDYGRLVLLLVDNDFFYMLLVENETLSKCVYNHKKNCIQGEVTFIFQTFKMFKIFVVLVKEPCSEVKLRGISKSTMLRRLGF